MVLPVEIRSGTPVLPNEISPAMIEEIEKTKKMRVKNLRTEGEFRIDSIWPQLTKVINWLLRNQFENAISFMHLIICRKKEKKKKKTKKGLNNR